MARGVLSELLELITDLVIVDQRSRMTLYLKLYRLYSNCPLNEIKEEKLRFMWVLCYQLSRQLCFGSKGNLVIVLAVLFNLMIAPQCLIVLGSRFCQK